MTTNIQQSGHVETDVRLRHFIVLLLTVATLASCASPTPTRGAFVISLHAAPPDIISVASKALRTRGYSIYLGNPGLNVMASQQVDTFWSPGARIVGVALTPVLFLTWPIVMILPLGEGRMWWPMIGFVWANSAEVSRQVFVQISMEADGWSLVSTDGWSEDEAAALDVDQLLTTLMRRFPARQPASAEATSPPVDNRH